MYKIVAAVIGIFALLIIGGILIFSAFDGGKTDKPAEEIKKLQDFASTDTKVRMIVSGPIVAEKDHREQRITVSHEAVEIEILKGYEGTVDKRKVYNNNKQAYENFLAGLEDQGFNLERRYNGNENELGACPLGRRFIMHTFDGDKDIQRTWTTSCSSKVGTFNGRLSNIQRLFQAQIPDYSEFVSGVRF